MSRKPMKTVEEYLKTVWAIKPPSHAVMKLYRGQSEAMPLLPRLFRPPNEASRVKSVRTNAPEEVQERQPFSATLKARK